jgi:hypothetical protein
MDFSNKHMMELEASRYFLNLSSVPASLEGLNWMIDDPETRNDEAHNGLPWMIHA